MSEGESLKSSMPGIEMVALVADKDRHAGKVFLLRRPALFGTSPWRRWGGPLLRASGRGLDRVPGDKDFGGLNPHKVTCARRRSGSLNISVTSAA